MQLGAFKQAVFGGLSRNGAFSGVWAGFTIFPFGQICPNGEECCGFYHFPVVPNLAQRGFAGPFARCYGIPRPWRQEFYWFYHFPVVLNLGQRGFVGLFASCCGIPGPAGKNVAGFARSASAKFGGTGLMFTARLARVLRVRP